MTRKSLEKIEDENQSEEKIKAPSEEEEITESVSKTPRRQSINEDSNNEVDVETAAGTTSEYSESFPNSNEGSRPNFPPIAEPQVILASWNVAFEIGRAHV